MLAIAPDLVQILIQWSQAVLRKLVPGSNTQGLVRTLLVQLPAASRADPGWAAEPEPHSTGRGETTARAAKLFLMEKQCKPLGHPASPHLGLSLPVCPQTSLG